MRIDLKDRIKANIAKAVYLLYDRHILKRRANLQIMSIDDTISVLRNSEKSMVRFGDSDVQVIRGSEVPYQKYDVQLAQRMKKVISAHDENFMVAIPDIFDHLDKYIPRTRSFWKDHLLFCRKYYETLCSADIEYGNAFVSRCYMIFQDKAKCREQFFGIREIWKGKDIVIVEGTATHNGVANNLLDNAGSISRIICPPKSAYAKYNEILATCLKFSKDKLFLLSLGPTAKPLAEDLFHAGYRVLDIGNLDMEYEWFLQGATDKVKLPKHEVIGEESNRAAGYQNYLDQIRYVIEN